MKKILIVFSFIMLANPAWAATCERPGKPSFPDPKTAQPAVVEKLDQDMQKYAAGTKTYIECLSQAAQTAQQEGKDTINFYNQKFLPEYNKRATP